MCFIHDVGISGSSDVTYKQLHSFGKTVIVLELMVRQWRKLFLCGARIIFATGLSHVESVSLCCRIRYKSSPSRCNSSSSNNPTPSQNSLLEQGNSRPYPRQNHSSFHFPDPFFFLSLKYSCKSRLEISFISQENLQLLRKMRQAPPYLVF